MGGVEPIDLPETPLIIGDNFPIHDETAYAREAGSQRLAAYHAAAAGGAVLAAANYTGQQFRGLAGAALLERLSAQHVTHTADEGRHTQVASWLDAGSDSIVAAKSAMNQISIDYHDAYAELTARAGQESWTQQQLRKGKDDLVKDAQERVRLARTHFDDGHAAVVNGVVNRTSLHPQRRGPGEDTDGDAGDDLVNDLVDRLILGGAWTWAGGGAHP